MAFLLSCPSSSSFPSLFLPHTSSNPILPLLSFHTTPFTTQLRQTLITPISPTLTPPKVASFSSTTTDPGLEATEHDAFESEEEEEQGEESPWEGAVVYRRDASMVHVEYSTTLERLGLGKLSSDLSRSRASQMGIRLMPRRGAVDPLLVDGTPVLVSVDVTRKKRKLRLDGIVRTVITLGCNRCAGPVAEGIFSNFTLLLTEEPIEESDEVNMGVIFGEDKGKTTGSHLDDDDDDDENFIDLDDRLHFPVVDNELDISKQIRDIVHVEITINSICDVSCKGLCLKCGTNLNKKSCSCSKEGQQDTVTECGPLKNLRKNMHQS